jgi:hypothetical protein
MNESVPVLYLVELGKAKKMNVLNDNGVDTTNVKTTLHNACTEKNKSLPFSKPFHRFFQRICALLSTNTKSHRP